MSKEDRFGTTYSKDEDDQLFRSLIPRVTINDECTEYKVDGWNEIQTELRNAGFHRSKDSMRKHVKDKWEKMSKEERGDLIIRHSGNVEGGSRVSGADGIGDTDTLETTVEAKAKMAVQDKELTHVDDANVLRRRAAKTSEGTTDDKVKLVNAEHPLSSQTMSNKVLVDRAQLKALYKETESLAQAIKKVRQKAKNLETHWESLSVSEFSVEAETPDKEEK